MRGHRINTSTQYNTLMTHQTHQFTKNQMAHQTHKYKIYEITLRYKTHGWVHQTQIGTPTRNNGINKTQ